MCLAQQVVLTMMLNDDASLFAQQLFTVDTAIGRLRGWRGFVFMTGKRCCTVIHR